MIFDIWSTFVCCWSGWWHWNKSLLWSILETDAVTLKMAKWQPPVIFLTLLIILFAALNTFVSGFNVETVEYKNISFTVWDVGGQVSLLIILSYLRTEKLWNATQYIFCLGQDQATLAPLLPEHPRTHLRRWQQWQVLVLNHISGFWQFFVLRERVGEARDELMRMLAEDELREAVSTKTLHLLCSINHLIPISGAADLRQQAGPAECNERRRDHWQVGSAQPEEQKLVHSGETETAPKSQVVTCALFQATCATSGDGLYEGLDWLSNQLKNAAR